MSDRESGFESYMDEVIRENGRAGKRRFVWSIPRCNFAREVWMSCIERTTDEQVKNTPNNDTE